MGKNEYIGVLADADAAAPKWEGHPCGPTAHNKGYRPMRYDPCNDHEDLR